MNTSKKNLPQKVARRQSELLLEIIEELEPEILERGRAADNLLRRYYRRHRELGSRDRRFLGDAFFSYYRWFGWVARNLGVERSEGALIAWVLDNSELAPALEYLADEVALPEPFPALAGVGLSRKCKHLNSWLKPERPLRIADLVPAWFRSSLLVPEDMNERDYFLKCVETFQFRPPTWLRVRPHREKRLRAGLEAMDLPWHSRTGLPESVSVPAGTNLHILNQKARGSFEVQDLASQSVGAVCDPRSGEKWWDPCAGGGGKALLLADAMGKRGEVFASDVRRGFKKEIKRRMRQNRIKNITIQHNDALKTNLSQEPFDGVLLDAPCSGIGTWARNPDARWRIERKFVQESSRRQFKLLSQVAGALKQGGRLIYAVCTLTREETLGVTDRFLASNSEFVLDPFPHPLTGDPTEGRAMVHPWDGPGCAMFMASFRKK